MAQLAAAPLKSFVSRMWDEEITPTLVDYIRIENKSPAFDPDWVAHGYMEQAVEMFAAWAKARLKHLPGATLSVERAEGRTPLILIEVPGERDDTVLLYGHLDKQPEMEGWDTDKGPWKPVMAGDKLYGRGGADDGYAMFGALAALLALREQGVPHARAVIVIEASEESGSPDLPYYMEALADRIGSPSLVVCLDSGCGDYERLWLTTSLRGMVGGALRVDVLKEGVHSGDASGVVPSSFRVLRTLLSRLEDQTTGRVVAKELTAPIPADRVAQARVAAEALGDEVYKKFPLLPGESPMAEDNVELVLNRTWRAALSVIGFEGAPKPGDAGNVLRPYTTLQLSMRLPPTLDAAKASKDMTALLVRDPPYGAKVSFTSKEPGTGWNAPPTAPWLEAALEDASQAAWGKPMAMMGEGGSIPFMAMLGQKFPQAQFVVTGVLGPASNAHGPNEFLHIPTGKRVTETVARVLAAHAAR